MVGLENKKGLRSAGKTRGAGVDLKQTKQKRKAYSVTERKGMGGGQDKSLLGETILGGGRLIRVGIIRYPSRGV